jgi:manganese transport protein
MECMPSPKHSSKSSKKRLSNTDTTTRDAHSVLSGHSRKNWFARLLPFLGPAFIASIAYVDPGNFATNIQGGAQFGYELLWVILGSNLMAMLLQALSAKLGIATGKNLAEHCRERFPRRVVWAMWVLMELVAMATDLAEFLGAAVALNLLFGLPLWIAGLLTAIITFVILSLERYGFRPLEAVITGFLAIIAISICDRTFPRPSRLGSHQLQHFCPALFQFRERPVGSRHPGRHSHAACNIPAFCANPGTRGG